MLRSHSLKRLVIAAAMLLANTGAQAQSGLPALQANLVGKTFFLRSLCTGDNLRFNADGNPAGTCTREPFTLGLLTVDNVERSASELRLTAHRAGLIFRNNIPQRVDLSHPPQGGKPHSVTLHLAAPPSGDFTVQLAAVLTTSFQDLLPNIPETWQGFFKAHLLTGRAASAETATVELHSSPHDAKPVTQEEVDRAQINPMADQDAVEPSGAAQAQAVTLPDPSANGVTSVPGRGGVSIPKVIRQQPATFSPQARSMRYGNACVVRLVVDSKGDVIRTWVHSPAGLGLDEEALASVAQFKFQPATKDGKPLAVVMNIEVNFQFF